MRYPVEVFTHTKQVVVHHDGYYINGFLLRDALGETLWKHGFIYEQHRAKTLYIPNTYRLIGFRATYTEKTVFIGAVYKYWLEQRD